MSRLFKCLVWNVRGINSQAKWDVIRDKIHESGASIVFLQETKRESFGLDYIRHFFPRHLDRFEFAPSIGASRGLLVIWNSRSFEGELFQSNSYAMTLKLKCGLSWKTFM